MKRFAILVSLGLACGACNAGAPPPVETEADYRTQIETHRAGLDDGFRRQPNNPIPPDKMNEFLPLKYFPPDLGVRRAGLPDAGSRAHRPRYADVAIKVRKQQRVGDPSHIERQTPETRRVHRSRRRSHQLFVPSATLRTEPKLTPRPLLELDRTQRVYTIDLQQSVQPLCYYNDDFDCPYPPLTASCPCRFASVIACADAAGDHFDFDGVIADTEPLHLRAYQMVLRGKDIELSKEEYYARYLGYDDAGLFRALAKDRDMPLSDHTVEEWVAAKSRVVDEMLASGSVLFPGAAACVKMFAEKVPLAIASGALGPGRASARSFRAERVLPRYRSASDGVRGKAAPNYLCLRWRN